MDLSGCSAPTGQSEHMLVDTSDLFIAKWDHQGPRFYSRVEEDDSFVTLSCNRERHWL